MKILIVSSFYPPFYRGGYELRCAEMAAGLRRHGHDVQVLTSTFGLPVDVFGFGRPHREEIEAVAVHRALNQYAYGPQPSLRPWTLQQAHRELGDARYFLRLIREFRPDVVNWWSMNGLSKTLLPIAAAANIPDVCWIEDPWMIREYGPNGAIASQFWSTVWEGRWGPRAVRPFFRGAGSLWERRVVAEGIFTKPVDGVPGYACFVSEFLQDLYRSAGLEFAASEIIRGGVSARHFYMPGRLPADSGPIRLLYAGQLSYDRGLHDLIEALGHLPNECSHLTLSITGGGDPDYISSIRARIDTLKLNNRVRFLGKVPYDRMPGVYREHDALVFPSTRQEGLPLTIVEALLSGCAVLTTNSGGAEELARLAHLPLFPANDPLALSRLLTAFSGDRPRLREVAARGQTIALSEFAADRMVTRTEAMFRRVIAGDAQHTKSQCASLASVSNL